MGSGLNLGIIELMIYKRRHSTFVLIRVATARGTDTLDIFAPSERDVVPLLRELKS